MDFLLKGKRPLVIYALLLIAIFTLFMQRQDCKFSLIENKSVPDIELTNSFFTSPDSKLYNGKISGFVAFKDLTMQPRDLKQYYIIEPTDEFDSNARQLFYYDEIIAMNSLPPKSIGKEALFIKQDTNAVLILENANGNQFILDKTTKKVSVDDETELITSYSAFRDFMWDFLR